MGSLDLLIQANNHIQTQSNHLTYGFLRLTHPSQHKDALHSQLQVLGLYKNVLWTKNEISERENHSCEKIIFQKHLWASQGQKRTP